MHAFNLLMLAGGLLVFTNLLAGVVATRVGRPFLLVFLMAGMLVGVDGPIGVHFENVQLSAWVDNPALAMILLQGGISTRMSTFRAGVRPAIVPETVGVALTAALAGAAGMVAMSIDWRHGAAGRGGGVCFNPRARREARATIFPTPGWINCHPSLADAMLPSTSSSLQARSNRSPRKSWNSRCCKGVVDNCRSLTSRSHQRSEPTACQRMPALAIQRSNSIHSRFAVISRRVFSKPNRRRSA
jgi:hypothetical protein